MTDFLTAVTALRWVLLVVTALVVTAVVADWWLDARDARREDPADEEQYETFLAAMRSHPAGRGATIPAQRRAL